MIRSIYEYGHSGEPALTSVADALEGAAKLIRAGLVIEALGAVEHVLPSIREAEPLDVAARKRAAHNRMVEAEARKRGESLATEIVQKASSLMPKHEE